MAHYNADNAPKIAHTVCEMMGFQKLSRTEVARAALHAGGVVRGCGEGTTKGSNGECVPTPSVCASGTTYDGKLCVLDVNVCQEGTIMQSGRCVRDTRSMCGKGTTLDASTGMCIPNSIPISCNSDAGTVYDKLSNSCIVNCGKGQTWNKQLMMCSDTDGD